MAKFPWNIQSGFQPTITNIEIFNWTILSPAPYVSLCCNFTHTTTPEKSFVRLSVQNRHFQLCPCQPPFSPSDHCDLLRSQDSCPLAWKQRGHKQGLKFSKSSTVAAFLPTPWTNRNNTWLPLHNAVRSVYSLRAEWMVQSEWALQILFSCLTL